jgi:hypothetical protein
MNMITPYWGDANGCDATSYTKTSYFDTVYEKLVPADITVQSITFAQGADADYKASQSITVGPDVTVESGARLTLDAPIVRFVPNDTAADGTVGFQAKEGAYVHVGQSANRE